MNKIYRISATAARQEQIVTLKNLRITVLTAALVRLEWSAKNLFADKASQKVWNRDLGAVPFKKTQANGILTIETEKLFIRCKDSETERCTSLRDAVEITLKNPVAKRSWRAGDTITTLKGTARTLDNADGAIPLEEGILSREGISTLDDSKSCLINEDGTITARKDSDGSDIYVFCYGHAYKEALRDFMLLTGRPPLLPRWALGNWWSRYHRYTQQEYLDLMDEFQQRKIPLAVAMIDMDWHLTQIDRSIGSGWTGYTWNRKLIPEPEAFLTELHKRNLKVSLNVHPAEGVGRHEEAYSAMKNALQLTQDGEAVPFDMTDSAFVEAYFSCLHHPKEKEGVDFWWIDWQQGETTKLANLDPLWLLNHYHFLDNGKDSRRSMILSRYAGEGSHRYPVGFSGDTVISWASLAFQPYFTATASNIGYSWWSHDIGGHMLGTYDEELQVRWVQFGAFSPILRLHSSACEFNHKEPWRLAPTEAAIVTRFLRLRHALIPYLYTMNVRFFRDLEPLIRPLYHDFPEQEEAYQFPNEYFFGSELIACPITTPLLASVRMAPVSVWIPEGTYTDVFTGITYSGSKTTVLYRTLEDFPLLLKAGGIVPLEAELYVALGAAGQFTLLEDDGKKAVPADHDFLQTRFELSANGDFIIHSPQGNKALLQQERIYTVHFLNCDEVRSALIEKDGETHALAYDYDMHKRMATVHISVPYSGSKIVRLVTQHNPENDRRAKLARCFAVLDKAAIAFTRKEKLFSIIEKQASGATEALLAVEKDADLVAALIERICNK